MASHDHPTPKKPLASLAGRAGLALACLAAIGCGGPATGAEAGVTDLMMDDGGLPLLDDHTSEAWWLAPPGCEGLLSGSISIAIASLEHHLVAAVDPASGEILCVDTVEAVGAELSDLGRQDDAAELQMRFETSEMAAQATMGERYTGDPHPEPNDETCLACGDPHPEPN